MALQVMFHPSGRGSLLEALSRAGRTDRVIASHDFLEFGPINPPDPERRAHWVDAELGYNGWEEVVALTEPFMQESLSADCPTAWFSQRDTHSFTGFLEWLWRLGMRPAKSWM